MILSVEQYLALSSLSYSRSLPNLTFDDKKVTIDKLITEKRIDGYYNDNGSISPELRPLSEISNYTLLNAQSFSSGMSAIALQNPDTKEIVFAFRGSELSLSDLLDGDAIKDIANADEQIFAGYAKILPAQFADAEAFVNSTLSKYQDSSNYTFTGHSLGGALAQYLKNLFSKKEHNYA